ncbi:MAG: flagellar hook protein FlgE [Burkholderiaceae bacterium]|nr:flagellar hook protein FlgE [Burkholderiaceae bacterium]
MNFQQGLSGLNASSKNLEVIGNNIANANTYGAKSSRAEFADMYATSVNGLMTGNIGIGVRLADVAQQFSQGSITSTSNPLDIAINGAGFFMVQDTGSDAGADALPLYTRNGQFKLDKEGFIVTTDGAKLLGYALDGVGQIDRSTLAPLQLPTGLIAPAMSTGVSAEVNLDARGNVITADFDPALPSTYNHATSMTVYDDAGEAVEVSYYFRKTQEGDPSADPATNDLWEVYATADGALLTDVDGNAVLQELTFDAGGNVVGTPRFSLTIPASGTHTAVTMTYDPATQTGGVDLRGITQFASQFSVTDLNQVGGRAPGRIADISVGADGILTASYTNGQTAAAGQIPLANFRNPQGLQPLGGNLWRATGESGLAHSVGAPQSGSLGSLQSGALEESNVDLTSELVNMITAQRIYQANAQTIKTQDSVLQTLVSLR